MDVDDALGQADTGRRPTFPANFPKKAVVLLQQWRNNNLQEFQGDRQLGWLHSLKLSFNKRKVAFEYLDAQAHNSLQSIEVQAAEIDRENFLVHPGRRFRTLDQWLTLQLARDPDVPKRAARTIDIGPGVRRVNGGQEEVEESSSSFGGVGIVEVPTTVVVPLAARVPTHGGRGGGGRGRRGGGRVGSRVGRGGGRGRGGGGRGGRGGRGRGVHFFGVQANGRPWPAPDGRWRDRLTERQRRDLLDGQAIMRPDTGHPGWRRESGITNNLRDAELEAIDTECI
jgi:hypothetical protein